MKVTNALNIDWDEVDPGFNFAAMNDNRTVVLFVERPEILDSENGFGGWWVPSIPDLGCFYTSEWRSILTKPVGWEDNSPVTWKDTLTERVSFRMRVTNALNLNWDEVSPEFRFAAMDEDGTVKLFSELPELYENPSSSRTWQIPCVLGIGVCCTFHGKALLKAPVRWEETLTERPVKV